MLSSSNIGLDGGLNLVSKLLYRFEVGFDMDGIEVVLIEECVLVIERACPDY